MAGVRQDVSPDDPAGAAAEREFGAAHLQLGAFKPAVNLGIATLKAGLIASFFMHVREGSGLVRLFSVAALSWLLILFGLGLSDRLTRSYEQRELSGSAALQKSCSGRSPCREAPVEGADLEWLQMRQIQVGVTLGQHAT